ncbi:hypothetical protein DSO57_1010537 [Entomophthora muscae]|uniref:Uncharacterized protein n=1 Tax=Entomophthora muscae TaxID=34485 RepID=A0ACC2U509_9FUNG|nr:hypothetical protein DSO57_1010537 [Entomophthora muscae]
MGLSAYFPQLFPVSSLWSLLQAAVPVLHWAASWWFVSLGWEPNLVSLAPLSHTPLPDAPPTQDFSKLGFIYITVLGLANQVVPHTGSWRPLATALNYLVHIAPIVYMALQARPASPVGVQLDSGMGRDTN